MRALVLTAFLLCAATAALAENEPPNAVVIAPSPPAMMPPPRGAVPSAQPRAESAAPNMNDQILNGISNALSTAQQLMGSYLMLQSINEKQQQQNFADQANKLVAQSKARDDFWSAWCGKRPGCDLSQPEGGVK